jgi:hypothetical protein
LVAPVLVCTALAPLKPPTRKPARCRCLEIADEHVSSLPEQRTRLLAVKAGLPCSQILLSPDLAAPKTNALDAQLDTIYGLGRIDVGAVRREA